ncbi:MAG TPA: riboflavin synthase [Verrucomicrobiae bacterium]|nr:riboflavin synthase [Verrucomicrobiae bacterium]
MFTGIVEETGWVEKIAQGEKSIRLTLAAKLTAKGGRVGDSLAVNGCCLTMVKIGRGGLLEFDLLRETWGRTNFRELKNGAVVNLERSLTVGGRLHGHFVTGHVDGLGVIKTFEKRGADWLLEIEPPRELLRYLVFKGAIAVDGISLTVAEVTKNAFQIWIIPHTYEVTALRERRVGSAVNLEADMLAKYAEKLMSYREESLGSRRTSRRR